MLRVCHNFAVLQTAGLAVVMATGQYGRQVLATVRGHQQVGSCRPARASTGGGHARVPGTLLSSRHCFKV